MSRQERGVTLFAGPFESQLLNGFEHATSASNIFDAIGALATSKANAPVKTVVLHEDVVLENPRVSIDAIRSIDPSAIIVYSGKQIHQHADASVDVKVTVERLQSAIANASSLPSDYDATDEIDLDEIPLREKNMSSYEIMLSESQERMLIVLENGKEDLAKKIQYFNDYQVYRFHFNSFMVLLFYKVAKSF